MAIVTEKYTTTSGKILNRTYSDQGKFIQNKNGDKYAEAIDPLDSNVTYTETTEDIPAIELTPEEALQMLEGVI